jgi:hypothetical protein
VEKLGSPGRVGMVTAAPLLVVVVVLVFVVVFAGKIVKSVFTMHCKENLIYVFPEKELHGFQFLHSYVCERFIYSLDRSTYLAAAK